MFKASTLPVKITFIVLLVLWLALVAVGAVSLLQPQLIFGS